MADRDDRFRMRATAVPQVRPVMQALFRTATASEEGRLFAMQAVLDWAGRKWPELAPSFGWQGQEFEVDQPGLEIGAVNLPERGLWGFRAEHPDSGVPGRMWTVEAVVSSTDEGFDLFGVRSQCTVGNTGEVPATSPAFVKHWIDRAGGTDAGRDVTSRHIEVETDTLSPLAAFLRNPDRQLPVIVVSQMQNGNYAIDSERLARRAAGLAHVVRLPAAHVRLLSDDLGREFAVFGGAVRTYWPGYGDANDTQVHLNTLPARIGAWPGADGVGPGAFLEFLVAEMHRFSVSTPGRLEQVPAYLQLRRYRAEHERAAQLDRLDTLQRDLAAREAHDLGAEIEMLSARLDEKNLELEVLKLDNEKSARDLSDITQLFNEQAAGLAAVEEERNTLRATNASLVAGLKQQRNGVAEVQRMPVTYGEIVDWVDQGLSDRLTLLSRARRGLRDAVFRDVTLVARCLQLLAQEYWSLRTAEPEQFASARLAFETQMQNLGVNEAASISDSRLGEVAEQYTVNYAIGFRSRQVLDRHLRGGSNSKDDHLCMRIYFFWDADQQKTVVGHLPSHLDTRAT